MSIAILLVLLGFICFIDLMFLIVISQGYGVAVISAMQLATAYLGWYKIRRMDLNLFFFVESILQKRETVVRELWDELLILTAGCLLIIPGVLTDLLGGLLLFAEIRSGFLDIFYRGENI